MDHDIAAGADTGAGAASRWRFADSRGPATGDTCFAGSAGRCERPPRGCGRRLRASCRHRGESPARCQAAGGPSFCQTVMRRADFSTRNTFDCRGDRHGRLAGGWVGCGRGIEGRPISGRAGRRQRRRAGLRGAGCRRLWAQARPGRVRTARPSPSPDQRHKAQRRKSPPNRLIADRQRPLAAAPPPRPRGRGVWRC